MIPTLCFVVELESLICYVCTFPSFVFSTLKWVSRAVDNGGTPVYVPFCSFSRLWLATWGFLFRLRVVGAVSTDMNGSA